ncbi:MAG: FAD-dependent oxidoreductase [Marinirhabdus sp.]|nr:FAD-dependent oxidoreductase [Marinirhabdus sp.]
MNLSYWEEQTWLKNIDVAIIGSGIVGLNCALSLQRQAPHKKIVVFERGMLPSGASTKNAGFACFGSVSEILEDLKTHSEDEVIQLVRDRVAGLRVLRATLGDDAIGYQQHGGYEIFTKNDRTLFEKCVAKLPEINLLLKEVFLGKNEVFSVKNDPFSFKNAQEQLIFNQFEGQIDTGKMMKSLLQKCIELGVLVLNRAEITSISSKNNEISLKINNSVEIHPKKVAVATNGFANQLLNEDVAPARAQVLVTHPIPKLQIKGTFHLDRGYYYFRNIDNRILLGGGRNLDFETESTSELGLTERIQQALETLLKTTILPDIPFSIDKRWSGIMGVGPQKKPIIKEVLPNVICGIRLGGMGIAIGSSVGSNLAARIESL